MKTEKAHTNMIPGKPGNPFKVPPGYFENLHDRVMENVREHEHSTHVNRPRKIRLRPYLALAASITGLAIAISILLQSLGSNSSIDQDFYDVAILEQTGIILDESAMAEAYNDVEESDYTTWEEEAITYLASNEVDLLLLLESN